MHLNLAENHQKREEKQLRRGETKKTEEKPSRKERSWTLYLVCEVKREAKWVGGHLCQIENLHKKNFLKSGE